MFPFIELFSTIGSAVGGLFKAKEAKATAIVDGIKTAADVLKDNNASEGQRAQAIASVIAAEANSESWITRSWRPIVVLLMVLDLHVLIICLISGHFPTVLLTDLPPILSRLLDFTFMSVGGYMGARSFEKILGQVNIGSIIKTLMSKVSK